MCIRDRGEAWTRTPANLGLRPLPQYETLEEARKALGPRAVPTKKDIETELQKLRVEEGRGVDSESDDDIDLPSGSSTALAKDPADYFGFVG